MTRIVISPLLLVWNIAPQIPDLIQPLLNPLLQTAPGRVIPAPAHKRFRKALHLIDRVLKLMGMLIPGAITP